MSSKSRGVHIPPNLKPTAFLLIRGLKLISGMTDRRFSVLYLNRAEKKKNHTGKKESNEFKTYD